MVVVVPSSQLNPKCSNDTVTNLEHVTVDIADGVPSLLLDFTSQNITLLGTLLLGPSAFTRSKVFSLMTNQDHELLCFFFLIFFIMKIRKRFKGT